MEDNIKPRMGIRFLTGVVVIYLIVFFGIFTLTYYGTRLPLGTLVQHNVPTQAR
jgi:hypothetical protein